MLEGLRSAIDSVKVSTAPKEKSKHYIPFSLAEWNVLEKAYGGKLMPKDLKEMLECIFTGHAYFIVKADPKAVAQLEAALEETTADKV